MDVGIERENEKTVKRYEGLLILNAATHEDGIKDIIDKVTAEIAAHGGTVETTQKMDKRPFARMANNKQTTGYYVNVIFKAEPGALAPLRSRFAMNEAVMRVLFTLAPEAALPATPKPTQ